MISKNPIDVLIYSSPKGGGNTYKQLLIKIGYKVFYTHNQHFFIGSAPIGQNSDISLIDYINLQISYRKNNPKLKKLKILFSWREHIEQQISFFFQNCGTGCINVVNDNKDFDISNVYKYINYFNNYYLKCQEDTNNFFELFPELKLSDFIKKEEYYIYETSNIDFYITRYKDIDKINSILSSIMSDNSFLQMNLIKNNSASNKPYNKLYNLFIDNYYLPEYVYNFISSRCKFLNFLLDDNEFIKYLNKWKEKIDKDKTLIIQNYFCILQNDSNKGYEKYITNKINVSKCFNNLPSNYFCLIYPDKHIILKDLLPKYINKNFNEKYIENLSNNERVFFNTNIVDESDFYKYDTHMNLKGTLKLFKVFIDMINKSNLFDKITVQLNESDLKVDYKNPLDWYCYGDLLWSNNINPNKIQNLVFDKELVYSSQLEYIYTNKYGNIKKHYKSFSIINKSSFQDIIIDENDEVNWCIISENILSNVNEDNYDNTQKILVYYDSFTCSLIPILFKTFKECIMIKEPFLHNDIRIKKFNPDLIFDFSVFRFIT